MFSMFKSYHFLIIGILVIVIGCKQEPPIQKEVKQESFEKPLPDWLFGKWVCEDDKGLLFEDWQKKNDSIYLGKSFFTEKDDTLFFENLRIKLIGDSLFYESLGEDITLMTPKIFKGMYGGEQSIEVENQQHSFPRKIKYILQNDSLMMIEVSGNIDGIKETQPYQMRRVQKSMKLE